MIMTPGLIYFLKINAALLLFYVFYRLLLTKDTFFILRRFSLLTFFILALFYPLFNLQEWIISNEPMGEIIMIYSSILPEVVITPEVAGTSDWKAFILPGLYVVYGIGAAVLLIRFVIQWASILWLKTKSKKVVIEGTVVYSMEKPAGPFSFFRLIFMYLPMHNREEKREILAHELTHVRQWHSVDVLLSEIISIICWVNPFIWLLKKEVRFNLEYLADNTVLEYGYDCKSYQYHLLGLAHQSGNNFLYNNFNVLHLRNRIFMMNKKRSHAIARTKYLMFIPLSLLLMLISNIEAVARVTKDIAVAVIPHTRQETNFILKGTVTNINGDVMPGIKVSVKNSFRSTETDGNGEFSLLASSEAPLLVSYADIYSKEVEVKKENSSVHITMQFENDATGNAVFNIVESMPRFPGGGY